ncbi:sugar porter family MFS transporter [Streptomyces sp. AC512_CC834]|uniref:sugar porter family MFS transporter n=1 Tax=Streptomyces sp. AC512_CC834 TaxID=2823691 RepID=UPI001C268F7B|nr:sugar porter family MFS transporter [Streptomyces sp. AC512_CC834]
MSQAAAPDAKSVGRSSTRRIYFFGALGGLLFGYDTGVIAGALLYIRDELGLTPLTEGLVVSSLLVGAMAGATTAGRLADTLGRRRVGMAASVAFGAGALAAGLAPNTALLVAARVLLGLGVGAASVVVPLYLSEMATTRSRGAVSSLNQLMITVGIFVAYVTNSLLAPAEAWRWMLGLAIVPSTVMLAGLIVMPETPRWLLRNGREEEAREVLARTRGATGIEAELAEIRQVEATSRERAGLREVFVPWLRPALVVGIGLAVLNQVVGINTIIYYAPTTLTDVGFSDSAAIYANTGIGAVNMVMTLVAIWLIDKVGRKRLLLTGATCMCVSLTVLAATSLLLPEPDGPGAVGVVTLACLAAFIVSFSASWGAVCWVVISEVFPLHVRGAAVGFCTMLLWLANFVVSLSFPVLLDAVGIGWLFLGFAAICALARVFTARFVVETKGRSLEDIELALRAREA